MKYYISIFVFINIISIYSYNKANVVYNDVKVFPEKKVSCHYKSILDYGKRVKILDDADTDWVKIRYDHIRLPYQYDNKRPEGWVLKKYIQNIPYKKDITQKMNKARQEFFYYIKNTYIRCYDFLHDCYIENKKNMVILTDPTWLSKPNKKQRNKMLLFFKEGWIRSSYKGYTVTLLYKEKNKILSFIEQRQIYDAGNQFYVDTPPDEFKPVEIP